MRTAAVACVAYVGKLLSTKSKDATIKSPGADITVKGLKVWTLAWNLGDQLSGIVAANAKNVTIREE